MPRKKTARPRAKSKKDSPIKPNLSQIPYTTPLQSTAAATPATRAGTTQPYLPGAFGAYGYGGALWNTINVYGAAPGSASIGVQTAPIANPTQASPSGQAAQRASARQYVPSQNEVREAMSSIASVEASSRRMGETIESFASALGVQSPVASADPLSQAQARAENIREEARRATDDISSIRATLRSPLEVPLPGSSVQSSSSSVNGMLTGAFPGSAYGPVFDRQSPPSSEVAQSTVNQEGKRVKEFQSPEGQRFAMDPTAAGSSRQHALDTPTRESFASRAGQIYNEFTGLSKSEQKQRLAELREIVRTLGLVPESNSNMASLVKMILTAITPTVNL